MGPGHLLFSGIGCQSPREVTRGKMARLLRGHVAQNHKLVNGAIGHASLLQSGSIGDTFECSALVGVLNELAHGERLS